MHSNFKSGCHMALLAYSKFEFPVFGIAALFSPGRFCDEWIFVLA
jgi:hypothetical protein